MADNYKMKIRQSRPIPGVGYSQYEIQAQADTAEELKKNYRETEAAMLDIFEDTKTLCNRDTLAKYLASKDLTQDFILWLKKNAK